MTGALLRFDALLSCLLAARRALVCVGLAIALHLVFALSLPRGARDAMLALAHPVDFDLAEPKVEERPRASQPVTAPGPTTIAEKPAPPHRAPRVLVKNGTSPDPKETVARGEDDETKGGLVSPTSTINGPPPVSSVPPAAPPPRPTPSPSITPPPPALDRSRSAALSGSNEWSCPWPDEADADGIDVATVVVTITVDERGRPTRVDVVDPGHGFGREARRCALQRTYAPALDREGRAVASTMKPLRVRFAR